MVKKSSDIPVDLSLIEGLMSKVWTGRGKEDFLDRDSAIPYNTGVVVFDGSCKSCEILVKAASHFDSGGMFIFVRNDHPGLTNYKEGITIEDYKRDPYLFLPDGRLFKAAEAMKMVINELKENLPGAVAMAMTSLSIEKWYNLFYQKRSECTDNSCSNQGKKEEKTIFSFKKHKEFE